MCCKGTLAFQLMAWERQCRTLGSHGGSGGLAPDISIKDDELGRPLQDSEACCICYKILLTAVVLECPHTFCALCVEALENHRCPACRHSFHSVQEDEETRKRVGDIPAKCLQCCSFTGTVETVMQHKKGNCPEQTVYCRHHGCREIMRRRLLEQHEGACDHKKDTCPCGLTMAQMHLKMHQITVCPTYSVPCARGCGKNVARSAMMVHTAQDCDKTVKMCSVPGCKFVGMGPEMEQHGIDHAVAHVSLLHHHNTQVQIGLAKGKVKKVNAALLYGEVKAIAFTIPEVKVKMAAGGTSFISPPIGGLFEGTWQVALQRSDANYRWYIYICLVSKALPLHLKVMFLLQSTKGPREDHAIIINDLLEVVENKKYGAYVPSGKLEEYSDDGDLLTIKVLLQKMSAVVKI